MADIEDAAAGDVTPNLVSPQLISNILDEYSQRTQEALIFLPDENLKYYPMITTSKYFISFTPRVSCHLLEVPTTLPIWLILILSSHSRD